MTGPPVVADASPLIGMARIGALHLLRDLYQEVLIPLRVFEELQLDSGRPGSRLLLEAVEESWLVTAAVQPTEDWATLSLVLDPGEAEAILLAEQRACRFVLLDERRGRAVARSRGLRVVGTGGVLLAAKERRLIERVSPLLEQLAASGYRLSPDLQTQILRLADE